MMVPNPGCGQTHKISLFPAKVSNMCQFLPSNLFFHLITDDPILLSKILMYGEADPF